MSVVTVILITVGCLLLYYAGLVGYDLYLANLADANKEEDNEKAIDISGQASDFRSIPVNNPQEKKSFFEKVENLLRLGVSATKMRTFMKNASSDATAQQLQGIYLSIQNYQTEQ